MFILYATYDNGDYEEKCVLGVSLVRQRLEARLEEIATAYEVQTACNSAAQEIFNKQHKRYAAKVAKILHKYWREFKNPSRSDGKWIEEKTNLKLDPDSFASRYEVGLVRFQASGICDDDESGGEPYTSPKVFFEDISEQARYNRVCQLIDGIKWYDKDWIEKTYKLTFNDKWPEKPKQPNYECGGYSRSQLSIEEVEEL